MRRQRLKITKSKYIYIIFSSFLSSSAMLRMERETTNIPKKMTRSGRNSPNRPHQNISNVEDQESQEIEVI